MTRKPRRLPAARWEPGRTNASTFAPAKLKPPCADSWANRKKQPRPSGKARAYFPACAPSTVTSDERTNTVFVNGTPDKIAQAKVMVKHLDVGNVPLNGK